MAPACSHMRHYCIGTRPFRAVQRLLAAEGLIGCGKAGHMGASQMLVEAIAMCCITPAMILTQAMVNWQGQNQF